jgi:hypothetical protein
MPSPLSVFINQLQSFEIWILTLITLSVVRWFYHLSIFCKEIVFLDELGHHEFDMGLNCLTVPNGAGMASG